MLPTYIPEATTSSLSQDGEWLDESDMVARYKEKPEQLAAMYENAERMVHPVRKCLMYKDVALSDSNREDKHKSITHKRESESMEVQKPRKQQKIEGEPKPQPPKAQKELTPQQKEKLKAQVEKAKTVLITAKEKMDKAELAENIAFVAPGVRDAVAKAHAVTIGAVAAAEVALEDGWTGPHSNVQSELRTASKGLVHIADQMDVMLNMAAQLGGA